MHFTLLGPTCSHEARWLHTAVHAWAVAGPSGGRPSTPPSVVTMYGEQLCESAGVQLHTSTTPATRQSGSIASRRIDYLYSGRFAAFKARGSPLAREPDLSINLLVVALDVTGVAEFVSVSPPLLGSSKRGSHRRRTRDTTQSSGFSPAALADGWPTAPRWPAGESCSRCTAPSGLHMPHTPRSKRAEVTVVALPVRLHEVDHALSSRPGGNGADGARHRGPLMRATVPR